MTGGYGASGGQFQGLHRGDRRAAERGSRRKQIIAEANKLVPGKPIKYVINTHAHFDHAGGLRAFVAEGATIVTSQGNKGYYEELSRTLTPSFPTNCSMMNPQPKIKVEYVGEMKKMAGGEQRNRSLSRGQQHA